MHHHGNKLAEGVARVLCDRMQRHPLFRELKELMEDEGELRVNGVYRWMRWLRKLIEDVWKVLMIVISTPAGWQLGCSPESARDSVALSSANSALIHHLGAQLATTEHAMRSRLVCIYFHYPSQV